MRKFLPTSRKLSVNASWKGFTLVELLVVVAIIAILASIGAVVYGSFQKQARDAARMSDINAISQAMEVNYGKYGQTAYAGLAANFFSAGSWPADPSGGRYCVRSTVGNCGTESVSEPTVASLSPSSGSAYIVCANLEAPDAGDPTYYCQQNQKQ